MTRKPPILTEKEAQKRKALENGERGDALIPSHALRPKEK
jgi:hypothetical protein